MTRAAPAITDDIGGRQIGENRKLPCSELGMLELNHHNPDNDFAEIERGHVKAPERSW